jgi:RHH-type proline utilization regulon transcriptional repressor/proline dehydrogenase/delta 1-pyrroline-5-carboxylate dehydrogenase
MPSETTEAAALEAAILEIGQRLVVAGVGHAPGLFAAGGLHGRLLAGALNNVELRTRLFRLVDVLPQLDDDHAVAEHFRAYLGELALPGLWGRALRLGDRPWAAFAVRQGVRRIARQFLAEETPRGLKRLLDRLAGLPAWVSLDAVGEAVLTEAEADAYRDRVLGLVDALAGRPDAEVSIKLSALTPRFDPIDPEGSAARVEARLGPIAERAQARGVHLTVDMEQHELKPQIQFVFLRLLARSRGLRIGIVLQAYLRDAGRDLETLLGAAREHGRRIAIRLVKGAYWDSEQAWAAQRDWPVPVLLDKAATDLQFEDLTRRLMENCEQVYPMIASHNPRSQAHALALARRLGLAPEAWEAQMLYGMAEPLRDALIREGARLRVYLPSGDLIAGVAYLIRRLLENTAGNSILRQTYAEARPLAELLRRPQPAANSAAEPAAPEPAFANAPVADFSQDAVRDEFARALAEVRGELGRDYPLAGGGDWLVSDNPAEADQVVGRVQQASPEQVDAVVAAARAGFHEWREVPARQRAERLRAAAGLLDLRRARLAAWIVLEAGKNWREADADVAEAVDVLRYYAAEAERLDGW